MIVRILWYAAVGVIAVFVVISLWMFVCRVRRSLPREYYDEGQITEEQFMRLFDE
jgi:hypothetical protein